MHHKRVTIADGDGIGPEIMQATLRVLDAANAPIEVDRIEIGKRIHEQGHSSGIAPESWQTIRRNGVFLKALITTPLGGGYKSLNVTIRKAFNLFANVRPTKSYRPQLSEREVGTEAFTNAIIARLGQRPKRREAISYRHTDISVSPSPETFCTDHWRCRMLPVAGGPTNYTSVIDLLSIVHRSAFDIIKTENLYTFDGVPAYSLGQGQ